MTAQTRPARYSFPKRPFGDGLPAAHLVLPKKIENWSPIAMVFQNQTAGTLRIWNSVESYRGCPFPYIRRGWKRTITMLNEISKSKMEFLAKDIIRSLLE
jgi:hypothetical protein